MRTSGMRSTEIYEPKWPVARIGDETDAVLPKDVYKDTLGFIKQRIRRGKVGYTVALDDGQKIGISQYLASNDFWDRWDLSDPETLDKNMGEIRQIIDLFIPKPSSDADVKATERPTLFDADFMQQGYSIPDVPETTVSEAEHGAFVTLAGRAIALSEIMKAISAANSADHASRDLNEDNSEFKRLYKGKAKVVVRGMGKRANYLTDEMTTHLNTLADTTGMRSAGFSEEDIKTEREFIKDELFGRFGGTGPEVVKRRHQETAKVMKTAEIARLAQRGATNPKNTA